ncbi:hypothetical protein BH23PLA1_BH23PLA1_42370 [soil metagenome]
MTPPPIRYPLPTLALLLLLGGLAWWGGQWIESIRLAAATQLDRLVKGPEPPRSTEVEVVAGALVRRVLILREGVEVSDKPDGPPEEVLRRRQFADVYDVWPLRGEPTHYRIGNRRPIGWVDSADVLPWDTRLVIRLDGVTIHASENLEGLDGANSTMVAGGVPLPVVAWTDRAARVALWEPDSPWSEIERFVWVRIEAIASESWSVWLSRDELLELIRNVSEPADSGTPQRFRAILGRLTDRQPISPQDLAEARQALPAVVFEAPPPAFDDVAERLSRINEQWNPDAAWGGLEFLAVSVADIP